MYGFLNKSANGGWLPEKSASGGWLSKHAQNSQYNVIDMLAMRSWRNDRLDAGDAYSKSGLLGTPLVCAPSCGDAGRPRGLPQRRDKHRAIGASREKRKQRNNKRGLRSKEAEERRNQKRTRRRRDRRQLTREFRHVPRLGKARLVENHPKRAQDTQQQLQKAESRKGEVWQ